MAKLPAMVGRGTDEGPLDRQGYATVWWVVDVACCGSCQGMICSVLHDAGG